MKVYKTVAYSSLVILLLTAILVASLPYWFPNSIITWQPIIIYSFPAIALAALLFIRPILTLTAFRNTLVLAAILSFTAALVGWLPFIIYCSFLIALGALYIQRDLQVRR
jgi:hypothetical protein